MVRVLPDCDCFVGNTEHFNGFVGYVVLNLPPAV